MFAESGPQLGSGDHRADQGAEPMGGPVAAEQVVQNELAQLARFEDGGWRVAANEAHLQRIQTVASGHELCQDNTGKPAEAQCDERFF